MQVLSVWPALSPNDAANGHLADAKTSSQLVLSDTTCCVQLPHFADLFFGQFGVGCAELTRTIHHVVMPCSLGEVSRIHAVANIAAMHDVHVVRDRSNEMSIRRPMRRNLPPSFQSPSLDTTISTVRFSAVPNPTAVRGLFNPFHKAAKFVGGVKYVIHTSILQASMRFHNSARFMLCK
jgi:hypothetical protein